ncbi:hypothetical protein, partial [Bordetella bronchiseptica]|uniref:hypothetical protein n=1 Tax=Bordetella bronchiseptica TaxID=518 RepID=UPI001E536247
PRPSRNARVAAAAAAAAEVAGATIGSPRVLVPTSLVWAFWAGGAGADVDALRHEDRMCPAYP